MRLWAEGDISIVSLRGDVSLIAGGSVNLDAAQRTRIAAPEIDLHAGVARFVLDELVQVGRKASLCVKQIRNFGEMIETFAEHVLVRAQRGSRFIEESDQLRAGDIDHRAESTLQMRAEIHVHDGRHRRPGGRRPDPHGLNQNARRSLHMFANTQMMGMDMAFPDVCLTPAVVPVPIPYPNIAMGPTAIPNQVVVNIMAMPAHNLGTITPMTNGDNAGVRWVLRPAW